MKEYLEMNMEDVAANLDETASNHYSTTVLLLKIAQYLEKIAYK